MNTRIAKQFIVKQVLPLLMIFLFSLILFSPVYGVSAQSLNPIDAYMRRLDPAYFSGAVLIVQEGEALLRDGYGFANDADQIAVTADTVFDTGSVSKQFTAAAIMKLREDGLLDVTDTLQQHFETVPADKAAITLHQLLTHTAGLTDDHFESDLEPVSREEALERIFAAELLSEPGTQYAYSNSGYTLLAAVVEEVSGEAFTDYLRTTFFDPIGMEQTGFYNDVRWEGLTVAHGYWNGEDQGSPATWAGPYWTVMGNGGVMSTIDDMQRWWNALYGSDILEPESAELLFTPHVEQEADIYYGYGWTIENTEFGRLITHNGGGIGGNSDFAYYVDQDLLVIMLTNRIVFKDALGLTCRVEIPATETSRQLSANILTGDFSVLPEPSFAVC